MVIFYIFILLTLQLDISLSKITSASDDEIIDALRNEDKLVVLYTKNDCDECEKFESIVDNLSHDFKEHLNAKVLKAINSPMVSLFSPTKEPAIIYFRRGLPLLYHGPLTEEAIINKFYENSEPITRELSDENFEHLTQAATGATTGDWFIFFYSTDCTSCQRLHACWEAVGAALKNRLNIARINIQQKGKATGKRFKITETPEFIYFRLGKMYRYKSKKFTPADFIDFATDGYTQAKEEIVPPEFNESIFDNVLAMTNVLLQQPYVVAAIVAIIIIALIIIKLKTKAKVTKEKTKKKK